MLNLFQKHKLLVSIAGGLFVLVVSMILARCAQNGISISPTSQNQSTPVLIDQAHAWGLITKDERLLYLAYALYEPESLPAQFRSNVEWFGEATVEELQKALNPPEVVCSMSPHVRNEFLRLSHSDTLCN